MGIKNWNSNPVVVNGVPATEIDGGWVNYLDSNNNWSPIDCILKQDENGFHVTNAPFEFHAPLNSIGEAFFEVNNRYDVFNKSLITADPFSQTIKALGVNSVSGELYDINGDGRLDAVKYPDAYGAGIHLVYYVRHGEAPELQKLIQFDSILLFDTEYEFEITYSGKTEISPRKIPDNTTRMEHRDNSDVILNTPKRLNHNEGFYIRKWDEPQKRGIGIKKPLIWDSTTLMDKKVDVISVDIRKSPGLNKYILTKHIKSSFFTDVVYPVFTDTTSTFYPDPGTGTPGIDSIIRRTIPSETWNTIHNAASGTNAFPFNVNLIARIEASTTTNEFNTIDRSILGFDTSSIPDGDSITSATLSLDGDGIGVISTLEDPLSVLVSASPASDTDVVATDYDITGFGSTHLSNSIAGSSWNTLGSNIHTFNASGLAHINNLGVTNFGWMLVSDIDNTEPIWSSANISFLASASADTAVPSKRPKLTVVHSPLIPPTPTPSPVPEITTHNQDAKNRLLEQYKGKTGIEGLIESYFGTQIQDLEDVLQLFFDRLDIEISEGVQLNGIGKIVNQDRLGLTDELYRLFLRGRIGANVSEGDIERLIEVWKTITQANLIKLEEIFPAEVNLASDVGLPDNLIDIAFALIQNVSGAGIGVGITTFLPEDAFAFDGANPAITKGFGSVIAQGTTDGTTPSKLVDSGASFVADGVDITMQAMNDIDGTQANIISVDPTELTLDADIFTTGEDYYINANTGGQLAKIQGAN